MNRLGYQAVCATVVIALWHVPCSAPALTITEPGVYALGSDVTFSPGVTDTIISIESSDVVFDLDGHAIIQTDATAGVDGIRIAPGLERITIRNGSIRNTTGRGIFIDTTTQVEKIAINDLLFDTCQSSGITISGTSTLSDCTIERCVFSNCILTSSGDSVLTIQGSRMKIRDILITTENGAGNAVGVAKNVIALSSLSSSLLENIRVSNFSTQTANLIVWSISGATTENIFKNIAIDRCQSPATLTIFSAGAGFANNIIISCTAQNCSSGTNTVFVSANSLTSPNLLISCACLTMSTTSGPIVGFFFNASSNQTLIDCIVQRISSNNNGCTPYQCIACTNIQFIRCYSFNNTATGASTQQNSFTINSTSTGCILRDCIAGNNSATGTSAISRGFFFDNSTECVADNNAAYRNTATATAIGFTRGATTNAFIRNIALRNGTTTGNQFSGFGASQFNTVAIASVNSITQPFTNAGLV